MTESYAYKMEGELLQRFLSGEIILTEELELEVYHRGRKRFERKKADRHPVSGRYRYRFGKRRDTVYKNRLVWIFTNKRTIPEGCVVDHIDGNSINDSPENLQLQDSNDSVMQGNDVQESNALDYLGRWFAFVGEHGREPYTVQECGYVETGF